MEEQLTALIASPLNMEQDGSYSVRIVNAFHHKALSKKAEPGMARGIKAFSSGAVLAYGENDTLEQAIMNGLYIEEGGRSKPSPIHSVQEKRNTQSNCDVTLRSKDQSELKRIVAYLARAMTILTKRGHGSATLEYFKNVPLLSARGPHSPSAEKAVRVFMYAIPCAKSLILGDNPCMDDIVHVKELHM